MTDYSAHLIAARKALTAAEEAANAGDWKAMGDAAMLAGLQTADIVLWAEEREREAKA